MDQTLEVRWFYDGTAPAAVLDWFMDLDPEQEAEREDLYLISNDPSLNVKLREGKIQLKRQSGERTGAQFHDRVRGHREFWQKWSFPLTDDAPDLFTEDPSGLWLPVTKCRGTSGSTSRPSSARCWTRSTKPILPMRSSSSHR
ncbi:MAG: hypothetical protein GVY35_14485 [Bacteroidetes bacterium]|jgi:hypothetical protein|nr:hypothetical protein [Bacteroidota bacterium]